MQQKAKALGLISLVIVFLGLVVVVPTLAAEKITLQVWDDYSSVTRDPIVKAAIAQFEQLHPNIEIVRTVRPLKDLTAMVIPALAAGKGPDVLVVNAGEQLMGPLVRANKILPLDMYAKKYGWLNKLLSPSLWNRRRYSADGTTMGTGNLYGVSFDGELVGVYYNKEIFQDLGLSVPQSITEFANACEKIKEAGIEPIALAGLKDYRFFHFYSEVQNSVLAHYIGADAAEAYVDDIVIRNLPNRTWVNAANEEAAAIIQDWVKKGYFINGFSGLGGTDDLAIFMAGKAAMFLQGSWYSADIAKSGIQAGFFPFPPYKKGEKLPPQLGGATTPLGINANSQHPDLAAEYLNILIASDKTLELQKQMGVLPARIPASLEGVEKGSLYYDLLDTWNRANEAGNISQYLDWTTPTMWDTLAEQGRTLMALRITPHQFLEAVEADYQAWLQQKATSAGK